MNQRDYLSWDELYFPPPELIPEGMRYKWFNFCTFPMGLCSWKAVPSDRHPELRTDDAALGIVVKDLILCERPIHECEEDEKRLYELNKEIVEKAMDGEVHNDYKSDQIEYSVASIPRKKLFRYKKEKYRDRKYELMSWFTKARIWIHAQLARWVIPLSKAEKNAAKDFKIDEKTYLHYKVKDILDGNRG